MESHVAQFARWMAPMPEPTLLLDPRTGVVHAANPAALGMFGLASDALVGRSLQELTIHSDEDLTQKIRAWSRSREFLPGALDFQIDGRRYACRANGALVETTIAEAATLILLRLVVKAGAAQQFVALNERIEELHSEIHRRVEAERALRDSAEWWRVTLSSIGDAVIVTDTAGHVVSLNPVAEQLTGWPNAEARGQTLEVVFPILHETTREVVENPVAKVLREGRIVGLANHTVLLGRDGTERPIDDTAAPIQNANGELLGVVLVFRDVTEERSAHRALRESERIYRAIGESIDFGVWVCDASGKNVYASDSFLDLVGLTQAECSGAGWIDRLHPDDRDRTLLGWRETVRQRSLWDVEHRFLGVDGVYHPILARGVPVLDDAGDVLCWAGINLDISRLKQAEAALRVADRRKDEFLATLAHELRGPLAPIGNAVQILGLPPRGESHARALAIIERQLGHMVRLVHDLLDLSRISNDKLVLSRSRVALRELVEQSAESVRLLPEARERKIIVDDDDDDDEIVVDADATRIAQVLFNLLHNACKFTDRGGKIGISTRQLGDWVEIRVRDDGIGLGAQQMPTLFRMFSQGTAPLDRSHGGLGIGLALVRRLVELHGGSVRARSEGQGQGSEFIVLLPRLPDEGRRMDRHRDGKISTKLDAASNIGPLKVLIADDNIDNASTEATLLEMLGHQIRVAYDGLTAVALAAEFAPDVALLDIGMPGINGYEAARRIRALPGGDTMRLIAITGWGQRADRERALESGFDEHLVKPIDRASLLRSIAKRDVGKEDAS